VKLAVVGGDEPFVRRAVDDLTRRDVVGAVDVLSPTVSVGDLVEAAAHADVLVNGHASAAATVRVPMAAIAAGTPAVLPSWSADDHRGHLDLDADAREAKVAIVTGASASPAVPLVLARHASRDLDEVRTVEVAWALPPDAMADPATCRAVLDGLTHPALVRPEGLFAYRRAGGAVPVAFPEPVGVCRAGTFGGAEAWRLADVLPGRPSVKVRLGGTVPWWMWAVAPSALLARAGADEPATAVAAALARAGRVAGDPGWAGVRVEIEGRKGIASTTRVVGGFDRLDAWNAVALALGIEMVAHGLEPGVTVAGATGAPVEILQRFHEAGARFAAFDPAA